MFSTNIISSGFEKQDLFKKYQNKNPIFKSLNKDKKECAAGIGTVCRAPQAHATVKCEGSLKGD